MSKNFIKSVLEIANRIKPTTQTTRKPSVLGPYFSQRLCMLLSPLAAIPMEKANPPTAMKHASEVSAEKIEIDKASKQDLHDQLKEEYGNNRRRKIKNQVQLERAS